MKNTKQFIELLCFPVLFFAMLVFVRNSAQSNKPDTSENNQTDISVSQIEQNNINKFEPSFVHIEMNGHTIHAENTFGINNDFLFTWYINRIDTGLNNTNVFKADGWQRNREFEYTFSNKDETDEFILISYIKGIDSDERISKIAAFLTPDGKGNLILSGRPIDHFSEDDISIEISENTIHAVNLFDTYGPQLYLWYVYQDDITNNIYKEENWSDSSSFDFKIEKGKDYFLRAYIRDSINNRKDIILGPLRID